MNRGDRAVLRLLTGAFLATEAFVGIALLNPATAYASPADDRAAFVAKVRADGMAGSDQSLLANGKWVCDRFFASDWNADQVAAKLRETNALDPEQAQAFVGDAVTYLCPQSAVRSHAPAGGEVHQGGVV